MQSINKILQKSKLSFQKITSLVGNSKKLRRIFFQAIELQSVYKLKKLLHHPCLHIRYVDSVPGSLLHPVCEHRGKHWRACYGGGGSRFTRQARCGVAVAAVTYTAENFAQASRAE